MSIDSRIFQQHYRGSLSVKVNKIGITVYFIKDTETAYLNKDTGMEEAPLVSFHCATN